MEREIIGYKLVKPEYKQASEAIMQTNYIPDSNFTITSTSCIEKLKQAGVLYLWCKPIYKEETFKKGEWVVITDFGKAQPSGKFSLNKAYKLKNDLTEENGFDAVLDDVGNQNGYTVYASKTMKFRKATNLEIAKAKYPKGTKFYSAFSGDLGISDGNFFDNEKYIATSGTMVFCLGEWAEIVKEPEVKETNDVNILVVKSESDTIRLCVNGVNYNPNSFITASKLLEDFTPEQINLFAKM